MSKIIPFNSINDYRKANSETFDRLYVTYLHMVGIEKIEDASEEQIKKIVKNVALDYFSDAISLADLEIICNRCYMAEMKIPQFDGEFERLLTFLADVDYYVKQLAKNDKHQNEVMTIVASTIHDLAKFTES